VTTQKSHGDNPPMAERNSQPAPAASTDDVSIDVAPIAVFRGTRRKSATRQNLHSLDQLSFFTLWTLCSNFFFRNVLLMPAILSEETELICLTLYISIYSIIPYCLTLVKLAYYKRNLATTATACQKILNSVFNIQQKKDPISTSATKQ
jgi:hypothetical protein